MARKLLIALFGMATCVAALLALRPGDTPASSPDETSPRVRRAAAGQPGPAPQGKNDCLGCTMPAP